MRILGVLVSVVICSALLAGAAAASPLSWSPAGVLTSSAPGGDAGIPFDPYVGKGDLNTKAVPVCCCSSGFCEDNPGALCKPGSPQCRCNSSGFLCTLFGQ